MLSMTIHCGRCDQDLNPEAFTPSQAARKGPWCKACLGQYRRDVRDGKVVPKRRSNDACLGCGKSLAGRRPNVLYCNETCRTRRFVKERPQYTPDRYLRRTYKLSREQWEDLLDAQGGRCAICRTAEADPWHVDHCHETGAIRGILCGPCNIGLGRFSDDVDRMQSAIAYLVRNRE